MMWLLSFGVFLSAISSLAAPLDEAKLAPPLPANLWIEMSRLSQPGVVGIYLDIDAKNLAYRRDPFFEFLEEFLGESFSPDSGPEDEGDASPIGTGFVIDKEGHILTNFHVVSAALDPRLQAKLQVKLFSQEKLQEVELIGRDQRGDIALLKLKNAVPDLKPLEFGDSDSLQVGEYVAAFGNPYGHSNSMTVGILSAKGRAIKEINRFPFLQTDASINPGNSGGPLLNTKGYVIGVNTAIDARAQGIGFAIPANYVKKVVAVLKSGGEIQRAFLGVGLAPLHPRFARSQSLSPRAAVITQVEPGSPAEKSGLKRGDVIAELNGQSVQGVEWLISQIADSEIGQAVKLKIFRSGRRDKYAAQDVSVRLGTFPSDPLSIRQTPQGGEAFDGRKLGQAMPYDWGFWIADHSKLLRTRMRVAEDLPKQPLVTAVDDKGMAGQSGIRPGDLILEVNGKKVKTVAETLKAISSGANRLLLRSSRGHRVIHLHSGQ